MEGGQARVDRGYLALLAAMMAIGLWIVIGSIPVGFGSVREVGPGAFPALVGGGVVLLQLINLLRARLPRGNVPTAPMASRRDWTKVAAIMVTAILWILLLPFLGYLLDTLAVSILQKRVFGTRGWVESIVQGVATTIFVFFLFDVLFYIDLPRGFLY